jgi:hypothetical protein
MNDPIVEEVRRFRDEHARKFNYDLDAIFDDLKRSKERRSSGSKVVRPRTPPALAH